MAVQLSMEVPPVWKCIDIVVIISLKDAHHRRSLLTTELRRVGLATVPTLYSFETQHPTNTRLGIFQAHQRALSLALHHSPLAKTILILEDDVQFAPSSVLTQHGEPFRGIWEKASRGARLCCRLGALSFTPIWGTRYTSIRSTEYMLMAHANLFSRALAEHIVKHVQYRGLPWDHHLNFLVSGEENTIVIPNIAFQRVQSVENPSTNRNSFMRHLTSGVMAPDVQLALTTKLAAVGAELNTVFNCSGPLSLVLVFFTLFFLYIKLRQC